MVTLNIEIKLYSQQFSSCKLRLPHLKQNFWQLQAAVLIIWVSFSQIPCDRVQIQWELPSYFWKPQFSCFCAFSVQQTCSIPLGTIIKFTGTENEEHVPHCVTFWGALQDRNLLWWARCNRCKGKTLLTSLRYLLKNNRTNDITEWGSPRYAVLWSLANSKSFIYNTFSFCQGRYFIPR